MATVRNEGEKAAIDAALAFANLKKVFDAERVYSIFCTVNRLRETGYEAAAILEKDRVDCDERLAAIAHNVRRARKDDGDYIRKELLPKVLLIGRADMEPNGRVILRLTAPSGVEAGYAYALALLHDPSREWGDALRRCKYAPCGDYFLAFAGSEGGPTPIYCCTEHQKAEDSLRAVARVAAYRKRLKQKAKQVSKGRRSRTGKTQE